jgi:MFS family permease
VQVLAGFSWAAYELAIILMSFECIPTSHRTSMLTAYNLGYAIVSVAGSLAGGLLLTLGGETYAAYLVVFAVSALARVLTVPLLRGLPTKIDERCGDASLSPAKDFESGLAAALQGTSRPPAAQPAVAP